MPVPFLALVGRALARELITGVMGEVSALQLGIAVQLDLEKFGALKKKAKVAVIIGCNRAAKPVKESVIAHAQSIARFGFLAKSIGTKTRVYPSGAVVTVIGPKMSYTRSRGTYKRGPRAGEPKKSIPFLYAWLLERGTKHAAKKPFLQPAWDQHGPGYITAASREIGRELAKVLG